MNGEPRWSAGAWRIAVAILCFAGSVYLVGAIVELLLPLLPPERCGTFERAEVARLSSVVRIVWALGHVLGGAFFLSGARDRREAEDMVFRVSLAGFLLVLAVRLPLASWTGAHALAAGRYLFVTWVASIAGALFLLLRHREPTLPGRPRRCTSRELVTRLALGSLALVLFAESAIDAGMFLRLHYVPDHAGVASLLRTLALNAALVFALVGIVFAITRRAWFSLVLVALGYGPLVVADALKMFHLQSPLEVLDVFYLSELRTVLPHFVAPLPLVAVGGGALVVFVTLLLLLRREVPQGGRGTRLGILALAGIVAVGIVFLAHQRAGNPSRIWAAQKTSLNRGLLFDLVVGALEANPVRPPGYADTEIVRVLAERTRPSSALSPDASRASVVVLLVESLTDPFDYGFEFTEDPIPVLRALGEEARRGRTISPAFGAQSANAEFELLTGMSMAFLPPGALAYRQYVRRDVPALPRLFARHDYRTAAILVDPPAYFDRTVVLPRLGFDEVQWLSTQPGVERDATGRYASDGAVVDAILALDAVPEPFFAFAFTNATHAPYRPGPFGEDAVRVVDPPNRRVARDLGGYANALRATDVAIGRLVEHFRASARPTLLVILGDHYPPFDGPDGVYETSEYFRGASGDLLRRRHAIPVWMWANFPGLDTTPFVTSNNYLGLMSLEVIGIEPDPLLQVVDDVRAEHPVFTRLVEDGDGTLRPFHAPGDRRTPSVWAYELLQYDLLLGERYYYETVGR